MRMIEKYHISRRKTENYWKSKSNDNSIIIEYQNVISLLDSTQNEPTKFRAKNWIEINDDSHGTYNTNSYIRFKTSM